MELEALKGELGQLRHCVRWNENSLKKKIMNKIGHVSLIRIVVAIENNLFVLFEVNFQAELLCMSECVLN